MHADDPEHILWTLTINAMNLEVDGDVRVEDGARRTQTCDEPSVQRLEISLAAEDTAIEDFKTAFPGSAFTVDASGKITITIPRLDPTRLAFFIFYHAK